jgi:hypothetical protein
LTKRYGDKTAVEDLRLRPLPASRLIASVRSLSLIAPAPIELGTSGG